MLSPSQAIRPVALALALIGVPAAARGDFALGTTPPPETIVSSPTQTQTAPLQNTSFNVALPFQQFDPTLGTLKDVFISFTGELHGDFSANYSGSGGNGTSTVTENGSGSLTLTGPQGFAVTTPIAITSGPLVVTPSSPVSGSKDQMLTATGTITDPTALGAFKGTGTINLDAIGGTFITGYTVDSGNGHGTIVLSDGATASVRYDYVPVNPGGGGSGPEPTSLVLMAIGAGGLLLAGRLRKGSRRVRSPENLGDRAV